MSNGNYKFRGTNTNDQQLIEVRTYMGSYSNFINPMKVYNSKVDRKKFIKRELVYPGFEANPYSDARVAMIGPYDFI